MAQNIQCGEDREWLSRVDGEIEKHLSNQHYTIGQLAASVYVSERHLRRRMKTLTGLGPTEYLYHKRLQHAYNLLASFRYRTVAQVARAVGFEHPGAFTRAFKRKFGRLPTELRGEAV